MTWEISLYLCGSQSDQTIIKNSRFSFQNFQVTFFLFTLFRLTNLFCARKRKEDMPKNKGHWWIMVLNRYWRSRRRKNECHFNFICKKLTSSKSHFNRRKVPSSLLYLLSFLSFWHRQIGYGLFCPAKILAPIPCKYWPTTKVQMGKN